MAPAIPRGIAGSLGAGHAGVPGGLGHGGGDSGTTRLSKAEGDDVLLAQLLLGDEGGQGLGGGQLHLIVDFPGAHVQGPAENPRKASTLLIWLG